MVTTVMVVIIMNELSKGMLAGVILSAFFFDSKISNVQVTEIENQGIDKKIYNVQGQLFFASVTDFVNTFTYDDRISEVEIRLNQTHV